jgi:hypothetical protein
MHEPMMTRFLHRLLPALALLGMTWVGDAHATRWGNGLPSPDFRFNALSSNRLANPRMVEVPLRSDVYARGTGDSVLRDQLWDPSARKFMEYVVSCALDKSQAVSWTDKFGTTYKWPGELGLCPEWGSGPASAQCQAWVSACVLARNNALGHHVLISARGYNASRPGAFQLQPSVSTDVQYSRGPPTTVPSTNACPSQAYGVTRACGFQSAKIGRCKPLDRVHVGGGGTPWDYGCPGPSLGRMVSGDMVFRVCEGLSGCESGAELAQSQDTCGGILPAVSFTCPASGTFSVLTAPYVSGAPGEVDIQAAYASYPAVEADVFAIREGAFFGTIFGQGALAPGIHVYADASGTVYGKPAYPQAIGPIYPKMYTCQSDTWSEDIAYATERLCTEPGMNCIARSLGRCDELVSKPNYFGLRCALANATGQGDYGKCVGDDGQVRTEVVTTWLNQPCDVVENPTACKTSISTQGK